MFVKPSCRRAFEARRGTSLIELLLATFVALVLIGAIGLTVSSGSDSYEQAMDVANVEAKARRVVERIGAELMEASRSSVSVGVQGEWIQFQTVEDVQAGVPVLSTFKRISLVDDPADAADDVDNDGDGSIDEKSVTYAADFPGAPTEVVGWGGSVRELLQGELPNGIDDNGNGLIDEPGLSITLNGDPLAPQTQTITVRLTVEHADADQATITRTVQTTVRARND